jgi:hypothetical protein
MPLRLNVGVSRKIGIPEYSSAGASCNVELELEARLLESDLDAFHEEVRKVYVACHQAVNDELARLQGQDEAAVAAQGRSNGDFSPHVSPENGTGGRNGSGACSNGTSNQTNIGARRQPFKPATDSQVKAICAIARNRHADLKSLLHEEYGVNCADDLSLSQASALIDRLKAACPA